MRLTASLLLVRTVKFHLFILFLNIRIGCIKYVFRELKTLRREERSNGEADKFIALRLKRIKNNVGKFIY